MTKPYKINCTCDDGVDVITNIIRVGGGNFIVEGLAIVTDFCFNCTAGVGYVASMNCYEDLTVTDLELFAECLK